MKSRIAFISEHASPLALLGSVDNGGQNVYVGELCKQLAKCGYEVDIYTRRDDESSPCTVNWLPHIRVIHVKAGPPQPVPKEELLGFMDEFTAGMLGFIRSENISYDLIHANFFMSAWVASQVKRVLGIPYVVTFHALGLVRQAYQQEMDKFPKERISIEKFIVNDADRIIAECPQDKEDLMLYYGAREQNISIIPCGFSPQEFYPINKSLARKKLGLNEDETILLQLGRMVPRKGVDNVIRALTYLKNKYSKLRLLVVGGEVEEADILSMPEIKRLAAIAGAGQVSGLVKFVGRKNRDMLKYYYSASDIFITTPWYEPFGITPLEAMACGRAVIGANVGGIKYSVEDGKTGLLVPPNDPLLLAQKTAQLIDDGKLLSMMQKNALRRVNKYFTWTIVAGMVHALYQQIMHQALIPMRLHAHKPSRIYQALTSQPGKWGIAGA